VSEEFGVAVNVFWKNLPPDLYDHKDTYGNKDLLPAQRATQIVDNALKVLETLPAEYRDFYARRLVLRIQAKAYTKLEDS
jgi:tRNA wybutosine-synthesizing protein 5